MGIAVEQFMDSFLERLSNLLGMLDIISICQVIFEMYERLKKEYRFKRR